MKKTVKTALITGGIILILIILIIIKLIADRASHIPENPLSIAGNSAGNLYNGGLFAECNGKVYFSNPYDNNNMYVMNTDKTEVTKLIAGDISMINILGDYLYYYSGTSGDQAGLGYVRNGKGFYRSDFPGKKIVSLARVTSDSMIAAGNSLYYTNFSDSNSQGNAVITLETISTEGGDPTVIVEDHVKLGGFSGTDILYAGMNNDHYLYAYSPVTSMSTTYSTESMYLPIVNGGDVYFLDLKDDYKLKVLSLADGSIRTIVDERIDTYNFYNGVIYYQNCDPNDYALKRCAADGSSVQVVRQGVYSNINITSTYVYFTDYNNSVPVYVTSTNGAVNVTTFDEAALAVSQ